MDARDQFPEHDRALREWFDARGWPVTGACDRAGPDVWAWRHCGAEGHYTLYVTKEVLDRNDPRALPKLLDERFAEAALREMPDGEVILCYSPRLLVLRYFEGATGEED